MALVTMPSSPAFTKSEWGIRRTVAISESPFTGATQVQKYDRAQWYATLTLPPMKREQAAEWQAFFMQCEGRANTFLLGDPDAKTVTGGAAPSSVSTSSAQVQGAGSLNLTIGSGKKINKGSYLQIGTGSNAKLYMVVDDNTGNGNVSIQPPLKVSVASGTSVDITSPQGVFRMDSNDLTWSANELSIYGVTFSCSEAL